MSSSPNYVARKSVIGDCGGWIFLCVLLCWLIVPIFIMIYLIVRTTRYRIEFYDDRIITRSGVFNVEERQSLLTTVMGVRIRQSFGGQLFRYGDVIVDTVGKWDVNTTDIKHPDELKRYLENIMRTKGTKGVHQIVSD